MSQLTHCSECGLPWGVILERGEMPSEKGQRLAELQLEEELVERLEEGLGEGETVNLSAPPIVEATEIVWVTEALSAYASEYLNCDVPEGPYWYDVDDLDFPKWLLKGRKRRWAYRWNCCLIHTESYIVRAEDVSSLELAQSAH